MRERKGTEFINAESIKSGTKEKKAPRARNRTVMLNAEETKSVRSKLQKDLKQKEQDDGFLSPKKLAQQAKQIEESFSESDVFISDDEQTAEYQNDVELEREVPLRNDFQNEEDSEFVKPNRMSRQIPEPDKIVLEEPAEFEEANDIIETARKEPPVMAKESNLNEKLSVVYSNQTALIGFLILMEEGSDNYSKYIELNKGRLIVTSISPKGGDFILIDDESVSPMHAVLRISDKNSIQILDQLSEQGTKIVKSTSGEVQELLGDKSTLEHGDIVSFGDFSLKVCLIG